MSRFGKWAVGGLVFGVLASAANGSSFQPISPEELKLTAEPLAPGAPAIILYRQVFRDDNGSTSHQDDYYRIKVLTEEGRKYANVEIPFFKGQEQIVNVRARTIRPDGSTADFGGQVFEKTLVKGRNLKYQAKTFTLPDVQVGSIIEYFYTTNLSENMLFDSRWILSDELFTKKASFSLKPYTGSYGEFSLRWTWHLLPAGATAPKEGPDHIVRMEASNIPAFEVEDYMPPQNELKSRVDFIYEQGIVAKEQEKYWKDVGRKRNSQLESFVGKRKAMEEAVGHIVSPDDPAEIKLRKIYDRVQQIRNTSYELEKTEQQTKREKEKLAANVEDVWKRGYGDGMQLTWLFLGLARAAGFEAYGCWVAGRGEYFFNPGTMQAAKLDSNVVLVKLNGKDLFFDPGAAFTPFGMLTWTETYVPGLRMDKEGGSWIQTVLPEASQSRVERTGKLNLSDTGDLEGKLTVTYTGLEAMYRRVEERNADEVARKKYLEDSVSAEIPVGSEIELTNKPDWNSSETPLVAEFELKVPGWAASAGRRAMIPAAIFTANEKGLFEHAKRVHPVYFTYPYVKHDDINIGLAPGWQVGSVPNAKDVDGKAIVYNLKVEQGKGSLRLTRNLMVSVVFLEQKYYTSLRNFFQAVRTDDGEQIVLQPGEIHASN